MCAAPPTWYKPKRKNKYKDKMKCMPLTSFWCEKKKDMRDWRAALLMRLLYLKRKKKTKTERNWRWFFFFSFCISSFWWCASCHTFLHSLFFFFWGCNNVCDWPAGRYTLYYTYSYCTTHSTIRIVQCVNAVVFNNTVLHTVLYV